MKWPQVPLGSVCRVVPGFAFKSADFCDDGIPVVKIASIQDNYQVVLTGAQCWPKQLFSERLQKFVLKDKDVVLAMTGATAGKLGRVNTEQDLLLNQRVAKIQAVDVDPDFIWCALSSKQYREKFFGIAGGAAQPNMSGGQIEAVEIPLPPPQIQRRIAEVLTAYDELMENNRRRMALLEEAARQLYAEWFVRLRYPGCEQSPLVDGVPQCWERVELGSIINVTHGFAFQGEHFSEEPTSRILTTPGNFQIGGGIKTDKPKYYREEGPLSEEDVLAPMDLIVTMTDLSKTCDTLGYPAFVPKLGGVRFLHNQRVGRVVPRGDFFPKYFLHCLMCDERYRYHVVGAATGVSVKHTSPKRILSYSTPLPMKGRLIADFENFAEPLFLQINRLIEANEKLRAARDLLLPRLMSGEIAV